MLRLTKLFSPIVWVVVIVFLHLDVHAQVPDYVPADGLVAWYPFNGNANDESGNSNDGIVNGASLTSDRFSNLNSAYNFDGNNDWIDCGLAPAADISGPLTYSAWIRAEGLTNYAGIIGRGKGTSCNQAISMMMLDNSNGFRFEISEETACDNVFSNAEAFPLLEWIHVLAVWYGPEADSSSIYLNGEFLASASTTITSIQPIAGATENFIKIGNRDLHSSGYLYGYFNGQLDDVGVWNRALTGEEVLALYNNELPNPGCTDLAACNFNLDATSDDGSCEYLSCILGCTNAIACNYNPLSEFEDGSCTYAEEGYDCDDNCLNDADGDGICDANEVAGCFDDSACNYDAAATDSGVCVYPEDCETCSGEIDGTGTVIDNDSDDDGICDDNETIGCQDPLACNYDIAVTDSGACVYPVDCQTCSGEIDGTGIVMDNDSDNDGVCDADEIPGCTNSTAENYVDTATDDDGSCYFSPDWTVIPTPASGMILGHISVDAISASAEDWIGAFTPNAVCAGATQPIIQAGLAYISLVVYGDDALTDGVSEGMNEGEDFTLQFFDASANVSYLYHEEDGQWLMSGWTNTNGTPLPDYDDSSREFAFSSIPYEPECGDPIACNYQVGGLDSSACEYPEVGVDCDGNCLVDEDNDNVCDGVDPCIGALDACGVCNGPGAIYACGCTEILEGDCNCDGDQLDECGVCGGGGIPDGYCDCEGSQLDALGDCGGNCSSDLDNDGVCDDVDPCIGALDACGVCNGPGPIYECGCTELPTSDCNCDGDQLDVLGVCGGACAADTDADGVCDDVDPCVGEYDECGICNGTGPVLGYDCDGICLEDCDADGVCDEYEIAGCAYESACNYNSAATDDDGSCAYALAGEDCFGNCLFDVDGDDICDQDEITGCQEETACNYDATATDAGHCVYADLGYDCDGACLSDSDQDGICDEFEGAGCTESFACNYDSSATENDGSCDYCFCLEFTEWSDSLQGCVSTAPPLLEACGAGTYWDEAAQACLANVTCPEDLNGDGVIGVSDLLQLLSSFGSFCETADTSEWSCGDQTNYHGYDYATVQIGDQCWFDANLYSTEYANGDPIELINSSFNWYQAGAEENPAAIEVVEDAAEVLAYGYFYNAYAVIDSRGICPTDWHVASDEDWMALESHLGMDTAELEILGSRGTNQGEQLKATATHEPAWDGTDAIDFTALPAGQRFNFGSFSGFGSTAVFWTNTTQGSATMMSRILDTGSTQIERTSTGNAFGASVRCVKDE